MTLPGGIRAVLFDAAGTLIETREPVGESYARVARDHGVDLPAWRIDDAFRRILARAPERVFPGVSGADLDRCERSWWREVVRATFLATDATARFPDFEAFFETLYSAFSSPSAWRSRPGCLVALRELRARGLALGVVSNFDRRLPELLSALDLAPLLDTVVLPSDAGVEKPEPRIFLLALERLAVPAARCVFVGDSTRHDLEGARAVGMRAIGTQSLATLAELPDRLSELTADGPETAHERADDRRR